MAKELHRSPVVPSARPSPGAAWERALSPPSRDHCSLPGDSHTGIPLNTRLLQQRRGNSMPGGRISNGKINGDGKREQNTKSLVIKVG